MISYGDQKFCGTIGTFIYGAHANNVSEWLVLPSIGMSAKMNSFFRLNAELVIPISKKQYSAITNGVMMYGFRFGSKFYGGVDFILPFGGDSTVVYRYFPLGIPIFSFGVGF